VLYISVQHDSQEFLALLLDSLHELLIKCKRTESDMSPCESFASSSTMTECLPNSQANKTCVSMRVASLADLSSDVDTVCSSASSEMGLAMTAPSCMESSSANRTPDLVSPSTPCSVDLEQQITCRKDNTRVVCESAEMSNRKAWSSECEEELLSCGLPDIQQLTCDTEESGCKNYSRTHAEANTDSSLTSPRPLVKKLRLDIETADVFNEWCSSTMARLRCQY
jgi:hypothetical protein